MINENKKVVCPYCGYKLPIQYSNDSNCNGVSIQCKGRNCKRVFELIVHNGIQYRMTILAKVFIR